MLGKGSKIYSIVAAKCPRCMEGNLYKSNLIQFKGIYDMYEDCPRCGLKYEIEPGFWWGAMYIAYLLSSGALLLTAGICMWAMGLDLMITFVAMSIAVLLLMPVTARLSRNIWLALMVKYDKDALKRG